MGHDIDRAVGGRQPVSSITIDFDQGTGNKARVLSYLRPDQGFDHLVIFERQYAFDHWELISGGIDDLIASLVREHAGEAMPVITRGYPERKTVVLAAVG